MPFEVTIRARPSPAPIMYLCSSKETRIEEQESDVGVLRTCECHFIGVWWRLPNLCGAVASRYVARKACLDKKDSSVDERLEKVTSSKFLVALLIIVIY